MYEQSKTTSAAYRLGCSMGCATFLLGVIFMVLKLAGIIDWHWAWISLPFTPVAFGIIGVSILFIVKGTVGLFQSHPEQLVYVHDEPKGLSKEKAYALAQLFAGASFFLSEVFIVLKLTGVIDWHWWVLLPIYLGPISIPMIAALLVGVVVRTRSKNTK